MKISDIFNWKLSVLQLTCRKSLIMEKTCLRNLPISDLQQKHLYIERLVRNDLIGQFPEISQIHVQGVNLLKRSLVHQAPGVKNTSGFRGVFEIYDRSFYFVRV